MGILGRLTLVTASIALSLSLASCGKKDDKVGDTGTPKLVFSTDINPIVKTSCSDSGCHGKTGALSVIYEDNEANFRASKKAAVPTATRMGLPSSDGTYMPRGKTIAAADKQKLLDFLNQ